MQNYKEILAEILVDETTLQARIRELGAQISADYTDGNLLLVCILRGGVPFLVDLSRNITSPHMMDFMAVSSYGSGKRESSGTVRVAMDKWNDKKNRQTFSHLPASVPEFYFYATLRRALTDSQGKPYAAMVGIS